LLMVLTRFEGV